MIMIMIGVGGMSSRGGYGLDVSVRVCLMHTFDVLTSRLFSTWLHTPKYVVRSQ